MRMCPWFTVTKAAIKTPTWIQPQKQHVEKCGSQEEPLHAERARAGPQQLSVEELEHGFKSTEEGSCRTQNHQTGAVPLHPVQLMLVTWETLC